MAKLKGIKNLTKEINKWTQKNFGIKTVLNEDFCAWCDEFKIGYTLVVCSQDAETFLEDVSTRYPDIKADYFLWCLLHEIGHCMTDYLWTSEDEDYFMDTKDRLDDVFGTDVELKNEWYHKIGDEYMATKWAGEYMIAHPKKMKKFCRKMNEVMGIFCKKNKITP